jgi:hypothetical protein
VPAKGQVIEFAKNGGDVTIEFVVGYAQWGLFRAYLWDAKGHTHKTIGEGVNTDETPDEWKLPDKGAKLDKRIVSWEVDIAPLGEGAGQLYSLSVRFSQGGKPLLKGVILDSGPLGDVKSIIDFVRMKAV